MEPPAKRPKLVRDTRRGSSLVTEASPSCPHSSHPSNSFEGHGVQNTGNLEVGRDLIINVDQRQSTSAAIDKRQALILDSLRFDHMDARQWSIKKADTNTCAWFLKTPEYVNWTRSHHNFLWIKGKPGAGKSTLMKFLLGQLNKQKDRGLLLSFFFNARGHDLEKTTTGLYRSLLLQLLESRSDLRYVLEKVRIGHFWTVESLKSLLEEAVQGLGDSPLVCLIDALDECEEAQIRDMVSFLSGPYIIKNRSRICFASRHYPHITVRAAVNVVLESQRGHSQDIARYINNTLNIENSYLAQDICSDLQKKASGVFMWVVLVVDILNRENDTGREHAFRERIQELPKDLHELFHNILIRDNENVDGLVLCLQWILFAREPLTLEQLYFAIVSGREPKYLASCHSSNTSKKCMKKYVLDNSKGLVELTESNIPTVQFIHESVRDFLLKDGLSKIKPDISENIPGQSHDTLKKCCLAYTNMEAMKYLKEPYSRALTQEFPFLEYATQEVLYHADQAQRRDVNQQNFLDTFPRSTWVKLHNMLEYSMLHGYTSEVSLLYILAERGMSALIRALSQRQSCFKIESERYGPPILAACATRRVAAIRTMLELEAEPLPESSRQNLHLLMSRSLEIQCASNQSFTFEEPCHLLQQLVHNGNEIVSLFFLEIERPNVHERNSQGISVLRLAIEKRITAVDMNRNTPLHIASQKGYADIAELLINHGVKLSAANEDGNTPLHLAVSGRHAKVARLLIDSGADVSATNIEGWTPLHTALSHGHIEIARLLIDRKADITVANRSRIDTIWSSITL
ncbi:hypothetical protein F5Y12DRAFT_233766 [Xylaria sp. FL1777]|nr:hypothetical protein F5Y12DRAFT_233766 [Xylaria sp. FL1777]